MNALLISLALILLFGVGIAALPYLDAAWRRVGGRRPDLQLWRVMARRGIDPDHVPATPMRLAVRRCVFCPSIEQCDRWLASNAQDGLEDFCPNATTFGIFLHRYRNHSDMTAGARLGTLDM